MKPGTRERRRGARACARAGAVAGMGVWVVLGGCVRAPTPVPGPVPARAAVSADTATPAPAPARTGLVDVRMVTDEADAVLAILDARARGVLVGDGDWGRLFRTEGYVRLKARELSLGRAFTDSAFRVFATSPELAARAPTLRETLARWRGMDVRAAAGRALAYLPAGTPLRARMYPEIKPATNSFVFEILTNPAIFIYLDPTVPPAQAENILAHELHHIGTGAACRARTDSTLPEPVRTARDWTSAFGEGRAMLAAAGGPNVDPQLAGAPTDRAAWQRNLPLATRDMDRLARFFGDILDGRIAGDSVTRVGYSFINAPGAPQGAFYTVGWLMSAVVEKRLGRAALVASLCDGPRLLADYQHVAITENARRARQPVVPGAPVVLPVWPDSLVKRLDTARSD